MKKGGESRGTHNKLGVLESPNNASRKNASLTGNQNFLKDGASFSNTSVKSSLERIPLHLKPYIVEQNDDAYTPIDHAGWRYIMKIGRAYFKDHAHEKYLDGLVQTGIDTEQIPRIEDIDRCLSRFGWGAVPISGFIPSTVFLELLSMGIMPIAAEMRDIEHLHYTPAPDIVHEAAGHAPIVADADYAEFLHFCGEMASKCIISREDIELHEAIRVLSDLKEDPSATDASILSAEANLKAVVAKNTYVSEALQLGRFIWWTVEYGLVGSLANPKIYGAGLLSSVGESYHCLGSDVKKVPLSIACVNQSYDITEPQPQLFVARDFQHLKDVARQLADTFAYRQKGWVGLQKALESQFTCTVQLDSGLQISGNVTDFKIIGEAKNAAVTFLRFAGPVQLSVNGIEIPDQGIAVHSVGYSTPLGRTKSEIDWKLSLGKVIETEFVLEDRQESRESSTGYSLSGKVERCFNHPETGAVVAVRLSGCNVYYGRELVYDANWGDFDLAIGHTVMSVFGGAADKPKYLANLPEQQQAKKLGYHRLPVHKRPLSDIYAGIRQLRNETQKGTVSAVHLTKLEVLYQLLENQFPEDWLARYEMLELERMWGVDSSLRTESLMKRLNEIGAKDRAVEELITRGLRLLPPGNQSTNKMMATR